MGADFINQDGPTFKEKVNSETYRYGATFHYRAKNIVAGTGNGQATGTITFKVAIIEGSPGREK